MLYPKLFQSRREFLAGSSAALGTVTLAGGLSSLAVAQAADEVTSVDLGYAWLLQGAGCNVFVIPGMEEDGVLMVDGGLAAQSGALLDAVLNATGQDRVHTLINTHFHPEQTGSNESVGGDGGLIIAHEETKRYLQNSVESAVFEGRYGPLADAGLPAQTLTGSGRFKFAGQEIVYSYLPAAHTNGDIFLYFPMLDTLITGGAVTTGQWPVMDIRQGAWIGGLVRAYEELADVVSADTVVIPAHGPVTNGTEIVRMRNMYSELHLTLAEQLNLGMGWDDMVAMRPLQDFEDQYGNSDQFVEFAHRSMQMAYVPD